MSRRDKFASRKNAGSVGSMMRSRVKTHTKNLSVKTRHNYLRACAAFDAWPKKESYSNKAIVKAPQVYVEK